MKKIISILVICLVLICGCDEKEETKEGFYLNYNDKKMELNVEFSEENYGRYITSFENANCAFGERDITYFYDGVEVEAYENSSGKLIVYSIRITGEEGKTNEGIKLYDLISDAISIYGNNYVNDDNIYTYNINNTSLIFVTQNDIIDSIEYRIKNIS